MKKYIRRLAFMSFGMIAILPSAVQAASETVRIAQSGTAKLTVAVPSNASAALKATAVELSVFLNRIVASSSTGPFITGTVPATFNPATGPGDNTIVLGRASDLNLTDEVDGATPNLKESERFIIGFATSGSNVVISGQSDLAVSHGVYELLTKLGCRWFLPTSQWEVLPTASTLTWTTPSTALRAKTFTMGTKNLVMNIYDDQLPHFKSRFIWAPFNSASGGNNAREWGQQWDEDVAWNKRNKTARGMKINASHTYHNIVAWAKSQTTDPNTTPPTTRWNDDYYALVTGTDGLQSRGNAAGISNTTLQLCVANPEVITLCQDYAEAWFSDTDHAGEISISMEPYDGNRWCECDDYDNNEDGDGPATTGCNQIQDMEDAGNPGFVTRRALRLANAVAQRLHSNTATADKYVGLLAYGTHAQAPIMTEDEETFESNRSEPIDYNGDPIPDYLVHPQIYVGIATAYLTNGLTVDGLVTSWGALTPNVGIYDYLSTWVNGLGMPSRGLGSDIPRIKEIYKKWYNSGTRPSVDNYEAQSTMSMGLLGMPQYLSMKVMWNTKENVDALRADFLTKCFGADTTAVDDLYSTMDEFYRRVDRGEGIPLSEDLMARLYEYLDRAFDIATDPKVIARLDHLAFWLKYCDLRRAYNILPFGERQTEAEGLKRYVWKIRSTSMVDSLACWRQATPFGDNNAVPSQDEFAWPKNEHQWTVVRSETGTTVYAPNTYELNWAEPRIAVSPEKPDGHPWKQDEAVYTHADALNFVAEGLANNTKLPEEPRSFAPDFVMTGTLTSALTGTQTFSRGGLANNLSRQIGFYLVSDSSGNLPVLSADTGRGVNMGMITYYLRSADGETDLQVGQLDPAAGFQNITFLTEEPNKTYQLWMDDLNGSTRFNWSAGAKVTLIASQETSLSSGGGVSWRYFYVPKGTKNVIWYAYSMSGFGVVIPGFSGTKYSQTPVTETGTHVVVPVGVGEDGRFWAFRNFQARYFSFLNIPGLLGAHPNEMVLPKEALSELVPSGGSDTATRGVFTKMMGKNAYYLRGDSAGVLPMLTVSAGWSSTSTAQGWPKWDLYNESGELLVSGSFLPDKNINHTIPIGSGTNVLPTSTTDTFLLIYDDKQTNSKVEWPAGNKVTVAANQKYPMWQPGGTRRYFFVPKGTGNFTFGGSNILACKFYNAAGVEKFDHPSNSNFATIINTEGDDDQIWYVTGLSGNGLYFEGIPGHLATRPDELLIPQWTFLD